MYDHLAAEGIQTALTDDADTSNSKVAAKLRINMSFQMKNFLGVNKDSTAKEIWAKIDDNYVKQTEIPIYLRLRNITLLYQNQQIPFNERKMEVLRQLQIIKTTIPDATTKLDLLDYYYYQIMILMMNLQGGKHSEIAKFFEENMITNDLITSNLLPLIGSIDDPIVLAAEESKGCRNCGKSNHNEQQCRRFCKYCKVKTHFTKQCFNNKETSTYLSCSTSYLDSNSFILDSGSAANVICRVPPGTSIIKSNNSIRLADGNSYNLGIIENISIGPFFFKKNLLL